MGTVHDEIIGPDMVPVCWSFANTGTIIKPQSSSFGVSLGNPQPLSLPDPFYTFMVDQPPLIVQQGCDPSVSITSVLQSKHGDGLGQDGFVILRHFLMTLNRAMLTKNPTGSPLRNT